ncbi:hypothetical protein [Flavobacterium sp. 3HN19-14]|uniref:hypothetical protein n=1 Tax=Flavobacterium sp. 3HN19-14 TaxID=3448133 RepID=UPI003EE2F419
MKISAAQIEQLYAFTRQHFVEYYDLQTELVDHLANAIEAKWAENPALSFDEILNAEFKKFGVFGFMNVVEKRQGALTRKYNKIVWENCRDFFEFPKVVFAVISFYLISLGLQSIEYASEIYVVIFGLLTLFLLAKTIIESLRRRKKIQKKRNGFSKKSSCGMAVPCRFLCCRYNCSVPFRKMPKQLRTTTHCFMDPVHF